MYSLWNSLIQTSSCIVLQAGQFIGLWDFMILTSPWFVGFPLPLCLSLSFHFSVNDIVVLGPEQFYATRDHYFTNFLAHLELVMDLRWTHVLFYSPREVKVVARGFSSANGITISLDKKWALFWIFNPLPLMFLWTPSLKNWLYLEA